MNIERTRLTERRSPAHEIKRREINVSIASLEGDIWKIEEQMEPLQETLRDFERQIYAVNSSRGYVDSVALEEQKRKIKELREDRDTDPRIIELRALESQKHEKEAEIRKLRREEYENFLDELKSEVSGLSDKAYKELDALTKEHIEPLQKFGMTEKAAKEQLEPGIFARMNNLEEKIKIYEKVQGDIDEFIADKERGHDIERLNDQLKYAERFK